MTLLKRYKEAEKQIPNFIKEGRSDEFSEEVLLFIYYAGHGCMDDKQYYVLNEDTNEKRFWPAEEMQRLIGRRSGGSVKIIVLNDCCRENYRELMKSMETEGERKLRLEKEEIKL